MVIDTSAFLAILQDEPDRPSFTKAGTAWCLPPFSWSRSHQRLPCW